MDLLEPLLQVQVREHCLVVRLGNMVRSLVKSTISLALSVVSLLAMK